MTYRRASSPFLPPVSAAPLRYRNRDVVIHHVGTRLVDLGSTKPTRQRGELLLSYSRYHIYVPDIVSSYLSTWHRQNDYPGANKSDAQVKVPPFLAAFPSGARSIHAQNLEYNLEANSLSTIPGFVLFVRPSYEYLAPPPFETQKHWERPPPPPHRMVRSILFPFLPKAPDCHSKFTHGLPPVPAIYAPPTTLPQKPSHFRSRRRAIPRAPRCGLAVLAVTHNSRRCFCHPDSRTYYFA